MPVTLRFTLRLLLHAFIVSSPHLSPLYYAYLVGYRVVHAVRSLPLPPFFGYGYLPHVYHWLYHVAVTRYHLYAVTAFYAPLPAFAFVWFGSLYAVLHGSVCLRGLHTHLPRCTLVLRFVLLPMVGLPVLGSTPFWFLPYPYRFTTHSVDTTQFPVRCLYAVVYFAIYTACHYHVRVCLYHGLVRCAHPYRLDSLFCVCLCLLHTLPFCSLVHLPGFARLPFAVVVPPLRYGLPHAVYTFAHILPFTLPLRSWFWFYAGWIYGSALHACTVTVCVRLLRTPHLRLGCTATFCGYRRLLPAGYRSGLRVALHHLPHVACVTHTRTLPLQHLPAVTVTPARLRSAVIHSPDCRFTLLPVLHLPHVRSVPILDYYAFWLPHARFATVTAQVICAGCVLPAGSFTCRTPRAHRGYLPVTFAIATTAWFACRFTHSAVTAPRVRAFGSLVQFPTVVATYTYIPYRSYLLPFAAPSLRSCAWFWLVLVTRYCCHLLHGCHYSFTPRLRFTFTFGSVLHCG